MAAKPVIFVVDDEPVVLNAVERDVRRQYGNRFRVLRADSGAVALGAVKQLKVRNEAVALFLVDQRMPQLSGVEFLQEALKIYPQAKRALLTAYADTEAAIRAINQIQLDYYFMKPWDPPEEKLYPALTDLLDDWLAAYRPLFEGIRVIGYQWSAAAHQVKDFLARNQVPYQWLDATLGDEPRRVLESIGLDMTQLPVVIFPDGSYLSQPTVFQLAEKIGLKTRVEIPFYDLIIVGAGPAGLAAGVYGASEGLKTLIIERDAPGGQAGLSSRIENYLGFPSGLSGADLTRRAVAQVMRLGAEILSPQEVVGVECRSPYQIVKLADGTEISCYALLIATGVSYRTLDIPDIERLTGAGVYYGAALTEAMACKDKEVYIVGGGNSAGQAAMYLSKYAASVTLLIRHESLTETMSQYLIDYIKAVPNIKVRAQCEVAEVNGGTHLETIGIADQPADTIETVPAAALFIFIGAVPRTEWVAKSVQRDPEGYILHGPGCDLKFWPLEREPFLLETSQPGIFVAGDVRAQSMKRIASAVGEGAMAIHFVHRYLATL
jgi:thioredoxin reductase (NADPH)